MITYRDRETREVAGTVEQGQREWGEPEWIGSLFGGREVQQQGFATEAEANGWVRGELRLS
jgi:hypothetical protein